MLLIVLTVLALMLILYMNTPKVTNNIVRYEDYEIDEYGILVYTKKDNDL